MRHAGGKMPSVHPENKRGTTRAVGFRATRTGVSRDMPRYPVRDPNITSEQKADRRARMTAAAERMRADTAALFPETLPPPPEDEAPKTPTGKAVTIMTVCIMLASAAVQAQAPITNQSPVMITGLGSESCATWLLTPNSRALGSIWVLGYWAGRNVAIGVSGAQTPSDVGHATDQNGLIGEVERVCRREPSTLLAYAATTAFSDFQLKGR